MVRATWPVRRVVDRWNTQTDDAEDLIYASKTLALEPLVTAAYWAKVLKRPEPGEVDHQAGGERKKAVGMRIRTKGWWKERVRMVG